MRPVISRILWIICLALLFAGFLSGFVSAKVDVYLNVTLSDYEIDPGDSFSVSAKITNIDTDENLTYNQKIDFVIYADGVVVYEDIERAELTYNESKTFTVSSNNFDNNVWDGEDGELMNYKCGDMEIEVRISNDVSSESDRETLHITGSKLNVGLTPSKPTPSSEIVADDVMRIKETEDGKVTFDPLDEDFRFRANPYGVYQLDVWDGGYCLFRDTFEVSNKLKITEVPENPYVGEEIRVKVLDIDDKRVENARIAVSGSKGFVGSYNSDSNGYVSFTIDEAGTYYLIASKTGYEDSDSTTINVKTKRSMDIKIEPIKQAIGKDVTITVTSGGDPIEGAEVTIKKPDEKKDVLSTSSAGKVIYKPALPGTYDVTVKKTGYETTTSSFKAMNFFNITILGEKLYEEISVVVKNQDGDPVEDASVGLIDSDITGLTNTEGKFTFILEKAGEYALTVKKEGYEDFTKKISIYGSLQLRINPEILDLKDSVSITVLDGNGERIEANIQITKPDGERETIVKSSHTFVPELAGIYNVTVSKDYYTPESSSFEVNPYPLDLDVWLSGKDLIVKATSGGEAVQNMSISVLTPDGDEILLITDNSGIARLDIKELNQTGTFVVSSVGRNYEKKTITKDIKSLGGGLIPILLVLMAIIALLILIGVVLYIGHRKRKGTGTERKKDTGLSGL
ncbi:MAG: hypothetical protein B6U86_04190 [Candidatus Altiarchaeales archaeon ex4484_43]|nr:MAG: hypothetical protein B6U86_04190 [Candidatus Altiarchaeales archaeon ex4484_43]